MAVKDLKTLLQKLNEPTTKALEGAVALAIGRSHYEVAAEHIFLKFLEDGSGDLPRILRHFDIDSSQFWDALIKQLEGFRTGNSGRPAFSPVLLQMIEQAWATASLHHQVDRVRSGHLFEALVEGDGMRLGAYADVLGAVRRDELRNEFGRIVEGSAEERATSPNAAGKSTATPAASEHSAESTGGDTALDLYTVNLTDSAREGRVDPVFARDQEIRQMVDILIRRRKNNPILVGEAGVGKTAIVEGLALRIAEGDVPERLAEVSIHALDLGLLQAGAGVKGEFENRLKSVITEAKEAPKPIVLFIDEAHTLIGAGGAEGTGDAANLLKPALSRGELRAIAATTWSEYKKYFEKDAALERRFQLVQVEEPSVEDAAVMMRGIKGIYEKHHEIHISDETIDTTVKLSARFITGRQLPDKAIDVLDTAAARVKMAQTTKPAALDDMERRVQNLDIQIAAVERDLQSGMANDDETLRQAKAERKEALSEQQTLEQRWNDGRALVEKIALKRTEFARKSAEGNGTGSALAEQLAVLEKDLEHLQGDNPIVHAEVNQKVAAQVVSEWTGIPTGNMVKDEARILLDFEAQLGERVLGQEETIKEIADTIRTAKAGLRDPQSPIGVFLFVGPSGVGKTECSRAVSDLLFGGERFLITINMSEYQESHTVSQLKGSPPGYVGYGEGGILTEAVRQRPYSVVLLDEVEKAHRDVMDLFYQVFDRGFMRDGEGREIDFKNTVIMMTSNLGSDAFLELCTGEKRAAPDELRQAIHPLLVGHFQAALLARMKVVPFYPLDRQTMEGIVRIKLGQIGERVHEAHNMSFDYQHEVVARIAERCTEVDTGARNIDAIIDRTVLPDVSKAMLEQMAEEQVPKSLELGLDEAGDFTYAFNV